MLLAGLYGVTLLTIAIGQRRARQRAAGMTAHLAATTAAHAEALARAASLRATIDAQAIVSVTDPTGRIVEANENFCRISGYTRGELIGQDHRIVNSGHHPPEFWHTMWQTVRSGRPWRGEVCNRAKDGSLYWVASIIAPCLGADGAIGQFLSVRTDITALHQATARAKLHEAQLELAQRVAGVGSWCHDHDRGHIEWSAGMAAILETTPAHLASGRDAFLAFVHPDDRSRVAEVLTAVPDAVGARATTHRLQLPDGRIKYVHIRSEAVPPNAAMGRQSVGTVQDVTTHRQAELELVRARELAEAASQAKTQFLANTSHEIRTPLTAILGYADLLEEALAEVPHHHDLIAKVAAIRGAGDHLLTILNDILDLSKIEAGRLMIEPKTFPLTDLLHEVHALFLARATTKGIGLAVVADTSLPRQVRTDPTRLRQILLNLVGNAVKFTTHGRVELHVAATTSPVATVLRCDVVDTGIGLDEAQARGLFQPFSQANAGITRRFGGTGLGLTISRRLAEAQGGRVELVHSAPGHGSRFRVELPVVVPDDAPWSPDLTLQPTAPPPRPEAVPTLTGRVLLAEDGPDNQRLIGHVLRRAGATVDVADNGRIAWDMLQAATPGAYDLLVTDVQMPELDGCSLAQKVRQHGFTLPVLALTAHATAEDRQRCLAAGCDGFAAKPLQRGAFLHLCHNLLAGQRRAGSAHLAGG